MSIISRRTSIWSKLIMASKLRLIELMESLHVSTAYMLDTDGEFAITTGSSMHTAPRDKPILVRSTENCNDPACYYYHDYSQDEDIDVTKIHLCTYHSFTEDYPTVGNGFAVVQWGGGYVDSNGWECSHLDTHIPDWWFVWSSESDNPIAVAHPVEWWELHI